MFKILFLVSLFLFFPVTTFARTTPEDILNAQKENYQQKIQNYSPENKKKLEDSSQKIQQFNKQKTADLLQNMTRQSEIFDEYLRRNNITDRDGGDGINRNLQDPIEKARYYLTKYHEDVAYQAAKIYLINPTGENNIKKDSLLTIATMKADLNSTRSKVIQSQNILKTLIK